MRNILVECDDMPWSIQKNESMFKRDSKCKLCFTGWGTILLKNAETRTNKKDVSAKHIHKAQINIPGPPVWWKHVNKELTFKVPISPHAPFQTETTALSPGREMLWWHFECEQKLLFFVIMRMCTCECVCVCVSLLSVWGGYNRGNGVKSQKAWLTLLFMLG